jgi:hypothetical protein
LIDRARLRIKEGTEAGLWFWSMAVTVPGEQVMPSSGRVQTRGEAARCLIAAYEQALARHRLGVDHD